MASKTHFIALVFVFATTLLFESVTSLEEFKLGVLVPYTYDLNKEYPAADAYASAVSVAVEKVNSDPTLLNGAKLTFVWNNTACNQTKMVKQQHWQIKQGVVGFVGPSCHGRKAAKIARRHNLAVVSFDCQDTHVSDKRLYPNVARTNPQHIKAALKLLSLLETKSLKRISIVYQESSKFNEFKRQLTPLLKDRDVKIVDTHEIEIPTFHFGVPDFIKRLPSESQATVMVTDFDIAREIVYNVYVHFQKNASDSYSRHTFVSVPLDRLTVKVNVLYPMKWFFSTYVRYTPERENITKKAFQRLLVVADAPNQDTAQYKEFEKELKKKASGSPWFSKAFQGCLMYGGQCIFDRSNTLIRFKGAYLYDAVIQFATALHEVRQAGHKPTGTNVVNRLKRRHFVGADGYLHEFDSNADVIYDYTILGLMRDKNNKLNMLPLDSQNRILEH